MQESTNQFLVKIQLPNRSVVVTITSQTKWSAKERAIAKYFHQQPNRSKYSVAP